jgi:hypothetical protein
MQNLIIEQDARNPVTDPQPWPIGISPSGTVYAGRPDAQTFVGVQDEADVQIVSQFADTILAEGGTENLIGKFPVFQANGSFFTIGLPIAAARFVEA